MPAIIPDETDSKEESIHTSQQEEETEPDAPNGGLPAAARMDLRAENPPGNALPLPDMPSNRLSDALTDEEAQRRIHRMSRRSFLWAGVTLAATVTGWKWLNTRPAKEGIGEPFRRALQFDERITGSYFNPARLAPTFPVAQAREPRPNGDIGLGDDLDADAWRLKVEGMHGAQKPLELTLDAIQALPRVEITTELKCIEGWSEVVHWAGARFADFAAQYPPNTQNGSAPDVAGKPEELVRYVSIVTPDETYYVGLDMASALHPQTLLCYEMNGQPLADDHGAPLRLVVPVKYGIKHIKRIGTIRYTDTRPADYWAEQGYDWYAGH